MTKKKKKRAHVTETYVDTWFEVWPGPVVFRQLLNSSPKLLHHFRVLLAVYEDSNFSPSSPTLVIVFLIIAILGGVKCYLTVVFLDFCND